jgi:hypothetical protein
MHMLDDLLETKEIRSALQELNISKLKIRMEMTKDFEKVLSEAPTEFAAYKDAFKLYGPEESSKEATGVEGDPFLKRALYIAAIAYGVAGAILLPVGIWTKSIYAQSEVWAGGALLVAAVMVAIATSSIGAISGLVMKESPFVNVALEIARADLIDAVGQHGFLSGIRSRINEARKDQLGHALAVTSSPGLSEVHERSYHVPTSIAVQMDGLLDRLAGASVGVAGPRGAGKSTLLRRYCEYAAPDTRADLRCIVSAPVDYVPKDFVLHLFTVFCRSTLRYFTTGQVLSPAERAGILLRRIMGMKRVALILLSLTIAVGALLHWRVGISHIFGIPSNQVMIGVGVVVITGFAQAIRTSIYIIRQIRQSSTRRVNDLAILATKRNLNRCRYLQTQSLGWSGTLQLPVAGSSQLTRNLSKTEYMLSYPEIVEQFRRFAQRVSSVVHRRGGRIFIGIDELDKIGSPDQAEKFLNEIKGVFGVPYVNFIVSVSDDALTSFERRGLPLRDAFDSSFDEIIRVGPLPYVDSRTLLYRRVIGLTEPYVALCHCMSGGLPRELIRVARQVIGVATRPRAGDTDELAWTTMTITADEIRRKAAAMATAPLSAKKDFRQFLFALAKGEYANYSTLKILDDHSEFINAESPEGDQLRRDFATYLYFCATLEEVFNERLEPARIIAATAEDRDEGAFDALAAARYAFAQDTHLAWRSITSFRIAWQLAPRRYL